ncbi:hypothetical protein RTG_02393 [Rhodotorula toruloides ATCC 204091]|uniref:Protein kinase-like domain-containing protein n=1 Tax=Rhodotorula toruloides TaxID=5286 RepID=A0A0K3CG36_RHOTO|nr:hypothetical protein RTG_02393 [Rhodotorula toruloides ATCC 204091]PRQ74418.1 Protein kinase-like domain-containing protein [Rhodotorula toruloides]
MLAWQLHGSDASPAFSALLAFCVRSGLPSLNSPPVPTDHCRPASPTAFGAPYLATLFSETAPSQLHLKLLLPLFLLMPTHTLFLSIATLLNLLLGPLPRLPVFCEVVNCQRSFGLFPVDLDPGEQNPNVEKTVLICSYFFESRVYRQTYTTGVSRVIKTGTQVSAEEGEITEWVRMHTTVPVPKVLHVSADDARACVEFEYVEGSEELEKAWPSLDVAAKETIGNELVEVLKVMQEAPHPANGLIASYQRERGAALHSFHRPEWPPYTPTLSIPDFFDWARQCAIASGMSPEKWDSDIAPHIRLDTHIVLTHGDLFPRNILVRDGHLAAIIDWELAGWWPEEVEAAKVLRGLLGRPASMDGVDNEVAACWFIADCIDRARAGEEEEAVAEQSRRREWVKFLLSPHAAQVV